MELKSEIPVVFRVDFDKVFVLLVVIIIVLLKVQSFVDP